MDIFQMAKRTGNNLTRAITWLVPLLWLLSVHSFVSGAEGQTGYSFTLDGKKIDPVILCLNATPDSPRSGDLVSIDGILLTLGTEKSYDFLTTSQEDGRLLLVTKKGLEVVGVKVSRTFRNEKIVIMHPFDKLGKEEIRRLRGIHLDGWNHVIAERIKYIDPERACVTITEDTAHGPNKGIPTLPAGLHYLRIEEHSNHGIMDYSGLTRYASIRFLAIDSRSEAVEVKFLKNAGRLKYLDLRGSRATDTAELSHLKELRHLDVAFATGVNTAEFLREMPSLVTLDVQKTGITDLSPLGKNKTLTSIVANRTSLQKLPQGELPSLRNLHVMSTGLSDQAVAEFSRTNPACRVAFHWDEALREALSGVSRLKVRSGGTCHRSIESEGVLYEEKDAQKIAMLIENIRIDETQPQHDCMCCGNPSFEFFEGDKLLLTVGFHHGRWLRWPGIWPGDGALTEASSDYLCQWLADHGDPTPLNDRDEWKRRAAIARLILIGLDCLIVVGIGLLARRIRRTFLRARWSSAKVA